VRLKDQVVTDPSQGKSRSAFEVHHAFDLPTPKAEVAKRLRKVVRVVRLHDPTLSESGATRGCLMEVERSCRPLDCRPAALFPAMAEQFRDLDPPPDDLDVPKTWLVIGTVDDDASTPTLISQRLSHLRAGVVTSLGR
jgi:hypothetical protein